MEYANENYLRQTKRNYEREQKKRRAALRRRIAFAGVLIACLVATGTKLVSWSMEGKSEAVLAAKPKGAATTASAVSVSAEPKESTPAKQAGSTSAGVKESTPAKQGESAAAGTKESTPAKEKDKPSNWALILVNGKNPIPKGYTQELKTLSNGLKFDARAIDSLNAMLAAAKKEGLSPIVCSAYRTMEKQQSLFNRRVEKELAKGYSKEKADIEARKVVAYPGTSEHNVGLAADIVASSYQNLDDAQAGTAEMKWLVKHCQEYGFILRYPKDKTDITGVIYEPWHFRYVGVEAAKEIMSQGICLEEYLDTV